MSESLRVGERVQVFLDGRKWGPEGWYTGTVVRIDPYSDHRSFHWVELDDEPAALLRTKLISVLNPKNIRRLPGA